MITNADIERLAALHSDEGIVSAYLRVDPRLAYDRGQPAAKFKGAYARARRHADEGAIAALEREHDRILAFLEDWEQRGGGIAVFSCEPAGIWEVIELEVQAPSIVYVAADAYTEPLVRVLDEFPRMAVVLLDGGDSRVYLAQQGSETQRARVSDELPNRHEQGGWSQARYQRHVDFHRDMHHREVAERLDRLFYDRGFSRLVLVGVETVVKDFETLLPDPVRQRITGRLTADFKQENDDHILDRARQLAQEDERSTEAALVEQIVSFTDEGGKGVLGLDETILALVEGRVDTLAVVDGLSEEGSRCNKCDYFAAKRFEQCPACSAIDCEDVPDIIEHAIEHALVTGGRVNFVYLGAEEMLQSRGGIGALLRYPVSASA